jgi:uncharacterized membrane protein YphA (DoxX/SURF4 family)
MNRSPSVHAPATVHFTTFRQVLLLVLRAAAGWHFLYEGVTKLLTPGWSSAGYLELSRWAFSGFFQWIASNPLVLKIVDLMNIWGLMAIGLGLMLGLFTRIASIAGMLLLILYYIANPPFVGLDFGVPAEGNYLVVDKNLVEFFALGVLAFFPGALGLDLLIRRRKARKTASGPHATPAASEGGPLTGRREIIKGLAGLPFLGAFGIALAQKIKWESWEEKNLLDAMTSASVKTFDPAGLKQLKGRIPMGTIRGREFSRLILGGNLLSGWAHSRDLLYVSQLVKAYHHKDRIFATLLMAEKCGVNTLLTNPILCTVIDEYWKRNIGKIQFISDCAGLVYDSNGASPMPFQEYLDRVQRAIDYGAAACYIQGETADYYMKEGQADKIARVLDLIHGQKVILGIGAHNIETVEACVKAGFEPDFWMKTLHHLNYWSARHPEWHDNLYCSNPERTIEVMKSLPQPFIAFKTMAAGAILPADAFRFAFENGADFVCAGMYDFQMVEDVNIATEVLNSDLKRDRPWTA